MDLLDSGLLDARSPYNYTFNFWNDYLGLSALVARSKLHPPSLSANSITESLKATLGLDDSPVCSCVIAHGGDGHADCCCCCCCSSSGAPPSSPPPPPPPSVSIFDLKERLSLLRPYDLQLLSSGDAPPAEREATHRESFGAMELHGLALDRRRHKQTHAHGGGGGGRSGKPEPKVCVFCRNNGAPEEVYGSHVLKAADGRVLCPILRAYTCPLCSANGDHAHTIKYCPLSRDHASQRATKAARAVPKRLAIF